MVRLTVYHIIDQVFNNFLFFSLILYKKNKEDNTIIIPMKNYKYLSSPVEEVSA